MAKQYGTTRSSSSRNPKGLTGVGGLRIGGGKGIAKTNTFSEKEKVANFEGSASVDGGYYSLMTKDGKYSMVIETENGYNEQYGTYGTTIMVGVQKGTSSIENLTSSFVETREPYRESMGLAINTNSEQVAKRINDSMPYYAELANKWIKKNK